MGKCPKISNTKVSDKMTYTNSADPDQTAPEEAYTVCNCTQYFKKQLHKKQNLGQNCMELSVQIFWTFTVCEV